MYAVRLNDLHDNPGARKDRKRRGRGVGSSKGKTAGRGVKGQKSRSGVAIKGFEGGQMPIHMRLPKRGFNKPNRKKWVELTIQKLERAIVAQKLDITSTIDAKALIHAGVIKREKDGVRLIGNGKLSKPLKLVISGATPSAVQIVKEAKGSVDFVTELEKKYERQLKKNFIARLSQNEVHSGDYEESRQSISNVDDLFYTIIQRLGENPINLIPIVDRLNIQKAKIYKYIDAFDNNLGRSQVAQRVNSIIVPQVICRDFEQTEAALKVLSLTSVFDQQITPSNRFNEIERVTKLLQSYDIPCIMVAKIEHDNDNPRLALDISFSLKPFFKSSTHYDELLSGKNTDIHLDFFGENEHTGPSELKSIKPSKKLDLLHIVIPKNTIEVLVTVGRTLRTLRIANS